MTIRIPILLTILVLSSGFAAPAGAQTTAWGRNGYVSLNGIFQDDLRGFGSEARRTIDHEEALVSARHAIEPGPAFDVTAGGRLKGRLGFGFGASYFRRGTSAGITAEVPHPFYFGQPRTVEADAAGLTRQELAAHVHLMWLLPLTSRLQAVVFGGPSRFVVKQMLVADVRYTESYPYDEIAFAVAEPVQQRGSRIGYNAGADVSFFFSRYVGVGVLLRVSRADVRLAAPGGGGEVRVEAGGNQMGAGMRFRF